MVRRFASAAALAACAVVLTSTPAHADVLNAIGPNQNFAGLVNDSEGTAVVLVGCPAPVQPGQMGRPLGGQTLAVSRRVFVQAGPNTGNARLIAASARFIGSTAQTVFPRLVLFKAYDATQEIPVDVALPCSGEGQIVFDPVDGGPNARAAIVKVVFRNLNP